MSEFEERYRAIASRDRRFDGQFYTAVRTTGIYCRPSCPARTPAPANVMFFETSAAAQEAGYRACKRCLPEAVPGTPAWDTRSDTAARAMRLIRDGVVERSGVEGLARNLGYSSRHLHRLMVSELGAGPLALARAARAQTARSLIVGSALPFSDIAFAAGFGSIRQFNETVTQVFDSTPSQLRARRRASDGHGTPDATTIELTLPFREPYDPGVFAFLAERTIEGVEVADLSVPRYARTVHLPHGPGAFEARMENGHFHVRLELISLNDLPVAVARIRHLFDLDADPVAVDQILSRDETLSARVQKVPGIRLPGSVDPGEILIRALVGQQISVAAARTHLSRLTGLGTPFTSSFGPTRLMPTAAQLAEGAEERMRGPARRTASFMTVTRGLANGDITISPADDPHDLRDRLTALPGVGPWTAGYLAMRVLHDPDVLLTEDKALLNGAAYLGLTGDAVSVSAQGRAISRLAERWSPWRSYASMHLWLAATERAEVVKPTTTSRQVPAIP